MWELVLSQLSIFEKSFESPSRALSEKCGCAWPRIFRSNVLAPFPFLAGIRLWWLVLVDS